MGMGDSIMRGSECTVFTVNIEDRVYRCPVSCEALYMLCRGQDPSINQLEAYLLLKNKVVHTIAHMLQAKEGEVPRLLEPRHFMAVQGWDG